MEKWKLVSSLDFLLRQGKDVLSKERMEATFSKPIFREGCAIIEYIAPEKLAGCYMWTTFVDKVYCQSDTVMQFRTQNHLYTFVRMVE